MANVEHLPNPIDRIEAKTAEEAEKLKKQKKKRLIIIVVILAALLLIVVGILLANVLKDDGWRDVTVSPGSAQNCSSSFTFRMQLDRKLVGNDFRAMSQAYTDATIREYNVYDIYEEHPGIHGLYELNHSVGQRIRIEPELYAALEKLEKSGFRGAYLGPVYEVYQELFLTEDKESAKQFDPYYDAETAAYFAELTAFASNPDHVSLQFYGNNEVQLKVSNVYRKYAADYELTTFIDFFWMKNAFILDYLREEIVKTGYTKGYIISEEGYATCLDTTGEIYEMLVLDRNGNDVVSAAALQYSGPVNLVVFHNYPLNDTYSDYYYVYRNNEFATPYIDPADGYYKSSIPDLMLYSGSRDASDLLLAGIDLVIGKKFDEAKAAEYAKEDVLPVYCMDRVVVLYGTGMKAGMLGEGYRLLQK